MRNRLSCFRPRIGESTTKDLLAVWSAAVFALALSCPPQSRWHAEDHPDPREAAQLFTNEGAAGVFDEMRASEIPKIPVRSHLRPCCAFGAQLQAKVGPMPIPGYHIGNILGPEDLGHHVYDSGLIEVGSRVDETGLVHSENNGLVYTCHAGFIDTAHVRDYSDWTIFLATSIARHLETGLELELPSAGGRRRIIVEPIDSASVDRRGGRAVAIELGQWLAFQMSLWHEMATWFGWSSFSAFPEKVSAFSPEDLYSNMIGVRIAAAIVSQRSARDEILYNRSVDEWFARVFEHLGAVDVEVGREAMGSLDGLWWDSQRRLPDPKLVLRRNLEMGLEMGPWLVPAERMGPLLTAACGSDPTVLPIANPDHLNGPPFTAMAKFVVEVSEDLAAKEPFRSMGRVVSDRDFPMILTFIRSQVRDEFGPDGDRPD